MKFHIYFVVLLFFMKKGNADYIQCYVCEDCEENEGELVSCALLGELQLIDTIVETTAETAVIISTTQTTTTANEINYTTSANFENPTSTTAAVTTANFENPTSTTAAVQRNLTTVSIPNAIESIESYEDMEWERESAESPIPPHIETTNGTNAEMETLLVNATVISANETVKPTDEESTMLLAETAPNLLINLTNTLQQNITTNTTEVLGLNATTSDNFLNLTTVATAPNATSATIPWSESSENNTATIETTVADSLNNSLNVNSTTTITEVLELNGTESTIFEAVNGATVFNTIAVSSAGETTSVNNTNVSSSNEMSTGFSILGNESTSSLELNENTTGVSSSNPTTAGMSILQNESISSVELSGTTQVNTTALNAGNLTSTEISILGNEFTNSVGLNGTIQVNTTTINSSNGTITAMPVLVNENSSSLGLNGTIENITTTESFGNVITTGISLLENGNANSVELNGTTALTAGNVTTTEIAPLESTSFVGLNGTTQVNTMAISSGNLITEMPILETTMGASETTLGSDLALNSGNVITKGDSTLEIGFMNSTFTLESGNSTVPGIMELTNTNSGNVSSAILTANTNGMLQNVNGMLQNITTTALLPNLIANETGDVTSETESQTNAPTILSNVNITTVATTVNNTQTGAGWTISEEYTNEDENDNFLDSEDDVRKRSKNLGKLRAERNTINAGVSTVNAIQESTKFLVKQNPTDFLLNKYSKLRYIAGLKQVNITYKCYTVRVKGENKVQINKGCIAVPANRTACELLATKYGEGALQDCKVCLESKCNNRSSSNDLKISFASIILTVLGAWLLS
ncbi:mucin-21 [Bactrocera oleae]|uniref:mucin-21 n=1 Tax=Bactrocera oleae TaxID=104688 RepID=UPI00387ED4CD